MVDQKFDPVLLPIIRRVMPNIIAHDIVGVQPMMGPTGSIFTMQPRYSNGMFSTLKRMVPDILGDFYTPFVKKTVWHPHQIKGNVSNNMKQTLGYNVYDEVNNQGRNAGGRQAGDGLVGYTI